MTKMFFTVLYNGRTSNAQSVGSCVHINVNLHRTTLLMYMYTDELTSRQMHASST